MLLRITRPEAPPQAWQLKFRPQPAVTNNQPRVLPFQHEKLRPNSKVLEFHLRDHGLLPTRRPAVVRSGLVSEDLDEALAGFRQEFVREVEGMQRDAGRGEEGEHVVGLVVEEGAGEQTTRRRDESGRVPPSWLRGNNPVSEHASELGRVGRTRVGVNVNIVEIFGCLVEEKLPKGRKWKWGSGEEHEC